MHQAQTSFRSGSTFNVSPFNGSSNNPTSLSSNSRDQGTFVNIDNVLRIYRGLTPLTQPYRDGQGRQIQLWNSLTHGGLIGSVLDLEGRFTIIPGNKIRNPLNANESPEALRLKNCGLKNWDMTFDARSSMLTLWPHLKGASGGKDYRYERDVKGSVVRIKPGVEGSKITGLNENKMVDYIKSKGYKETDDLNLFVKESPWKINRNVDARCREYHYIRINRKAECIDVYKGGYIYGTQISAEARKTGMLNWAKRDIEYHKKEARARGKKPDAEYISRRWRDCQYMCTPTRWRIRYNQWEFIDSRGVFKKLEETEQKTALGGKDPTLKVFSTKKSFSNGL